MMKNLTPKTIDYTPSGNKMMPVYKKVFDEKTKESHVLKVSEFDIDEFIQASNSQTDLAMLRQQMATTGQIPVVDDEVVDATLFPENIHELMDTINNIENNFNGLPDSVKQIFGNKDAYVSALVDGTYNDKLLKGLTKYYEGQNQQAQQEAKKEGEQVNE